MGVQPTDEPSTHDNLVLNIQIIIEQVRRLMYLSEIKLALGELKNS